MLEEIASRFISSAVVASQRSFSNSESSGVRPSVNFYKTRYFSAVYSQNLLKSSTNV